MMIEDDDNLKMIFKLKRLESFQGRWRVPRGSKHLTPAKFAAAGFYYSGSKSIPDNVKCFACRKELSDWEKDDDPWEEHKKRGEKCMFVQLQLKPKATLKDVFTLYYQMLRNILIESFEEARKRGQENHYSLTDLINSLKNKTTL